MSRNIDNTFASSHTAAVYHSYTQLKSSTSSPPSPSSSLPSNMSSAPPPPPLQVVPAPPPDRPKRKRLARACNSCHKSKRRCDGTAPCSNCYYASKPCTYTDSSGRTVPAPRAAAIGPVGIPPNPGTGNRTQRPIELAQNMSSQDAHPSTGPTSLHSQQSTYGHTVPPYHLPPPPLPTLLPHQQQAQSSSHQHLFSLPNQNTPSNYFVTTPVPPRHEWDVGETPSASMLPPHPANQSRKRQRQGRTDFESRETLDTNRARDQVNQQTAADHRTTTFEPALVGGYAARPSIELEPSLTRELTNCAFLSFSLAFLGPGFHCFFNLFFFVSNIRPFIFLSNGALSCFSLRVISRLPVQLACALNLVFRALSFVHKVLLCLVLMRRSAPHSQTAFEKCNDLPPISPVSARVHPRGFISFEFLGKICVLFRSLTPSAPVFFTHSHPMVMIIHKPSFTNAVTMNQVPMYLLYVSVLTLSEFPESSILFFIFMTFTLFRCSVPSFYRTIGFKDID
ncbi:hypothetical protein DFH05DRAFT_1036342 [Lentinula detonsa]|uniref:Zn(2)-C6 fungal-type domain-containing protein n=1 Tax=Lentinula detonsa TaxID=2804962 RepID=A0A9W8P2I1_9AGAR|nr:hypothetical protein DFH05DRAFT_1036342 [Lentinula detonsa]